MSMNKIEKVTREKLEIAGYRIIDDLPNTSELSRWNNIQIDCNFSNPQLNRLINSVFPPKAPIESSQSMHEITTPLAVTDIALKSKDGKGCASDFTSSKGQTFAGFGFTNHCPFYDPTDVVEDTRETKLFACFQTSIEAADKQLGGDSVVEVARKLASTITVYNDLSQVSETKKNTS